MSPREIVEDLLELLFPPRCQVCGELADSPLCQTCLAEALFIESPRCLYCGVPIPESQAPHQLCADCREGRWLSGMRAVGLHAGVLREAVIRYKFDGRTRLAETLGRMLGDVIEAESERGGLPLGTCAGLVPVPLHPNRRRWRGFDQAELLCEPVAEQAGLPVWTDALERVRDTPPQTEVSGQRRHENVKGAFEARKEWKLRGASVILVDDVLTTGATMEECALVLRRAGAAAIYGLTVTRGAPAWHQAAIGHTRSARQEDNNDGASDNPR